MTDPSLILGLESRLLNAWPSFDYKVYDGWILRLANGYSKRANSASPFMPGAGLTAELRNWRLAPSVPKGSFDFTPPADAKRLDFETLRAAKS